MDTQKEISLYFKEGSSDKEYHAQLKPEKGKWVVTFQYGRRGAALTAGTKTPAPVEYAVALKAYDKIVKEKVAKGYSPGEAGAVFQGTSNEDRFTGVNCQLLNPIEESDALPLLTDSAWAAQEKYDGNRRLVKTAPTRSIGINRKGLEVPLPASIATELSLPGLPQPLLTDGELMGEQYVIFDVLEAGGRDLRTNSYRDRLNVLESISKILIKHKAGTRIAPTALGTSEKKALYASLKEKGREGVVFKRLDAPYSAGRPNSGGNQLKRKFTHSATFMVEKRNASKRSVTLYLFDSSGQKVQLGNVTIPANYSIPEKDALVEVEYLYAYPNGALAQPQYKGERDDLYPSACTTNQLHYKTETAEDEDSA
jgi:bifunctional non-homologous end joining protein LigD